MKGNTVMEIYKYPTHEEWASIISRPETSSENLDESVGRILEEVKAYGDDAVKKYEKMFDHVSLSSLRVCVNEIDEAVAQISKELYDALIMAYNNIYKFHAAQHIPIRKIETQPGITCWQKSVPIEKVGLYVPGGTAPLFSTVLMLATPAKISGCSEIVLCTPPSADGKINPAILAAAKIAGVNNIFKIGGVQAIGAMAYGTESVPKVYKIFGPGNRYVMAAKQQVSLHDVAIDMPAGPSEVCIISDDSSNPAYIAADLLSQAEHGIDSQVMLITTSEKTLAYVQKEINIQLKRLPRREIAAESLSKSKLIVVKNTEEAIGLSNTYAPEHLIITTSDSEALAEKVINAGSVFIGNYACESAGDYASGTNHTLPTHGYSTAYSGVNLDSFNRKITFQHITAEGIRNIGRTVEIMAENEQLYAHKNAMTLRLNGI